jgi:hypothetical protein
MLSTLAEETALHETYAIVHFTNNYRAFEDWRIIDTMISRAISKEDIKSSESGMLI